MRKTAIVVLADGFEEIEAITIINALRRAGIKVTICGLDTDLVKGSRDITISADKLLDESDVGSEYDACVLPGGMPGAENLASSDMLKELITKMHAQGKVIAAICSSPALVLSYLNILDNKSATCFPGMRGDFSSLTTYKEDNVVIDGKIITSKGPATAMEFSLSIVETLCGKDIACRVGKSLLYK